MNRKQLDDILDARALDAPSDDVKMNRILSLWLNARLAADPGLRVEMVRIMLRDFNPAKQVLKETL